MLVDACDHLMLESCRAPAVIGPIVNNEFVRGATGMPRSGVTQYVQVIDWIYRAGYSRCVGNISIVYLGYQNEDDPRRF